MQPTALAATEGLCCSVCGLFVAWLTHAVSRAHLLHVRCTFVCINASLRPARFALMSTNSYKDLPDAGWKAALAQLHDDYFYK